jgi:hypothetical protein
MVIYAYPLKEVGYVEELQKMELRPFLGVPDRDGKEMRYENVDANRMEVMNFLRFSRLHRAEYILAFDQVMADCIEGLRGPTLRLQWGNDTAIHDDPEEHASDIRAMRNAKEKQRTVEWKFNGWRENEPQYMCGRRYSMFFEM